MQLVLIYSVLFPGYLIRNSYKEREQLVLLQRPLLRSAEKHSQRARNPKKMRGGVTRKRLSQLTQQELLTALEELPADVVKQIGERHPLLIPPFTNDTLRRAVNDYLAGGARKEDIVDKYGEINNWDVSNVTDMALLFKDESSFNQPLNKWDVSNVTYMNRMFDGAESFTSRSTSGTCPK